METGMTKLGVNVDHIATIREARKTYEPDPLEAARICEMAGCHGITVHLREDARHIQKKDVISIREKIHTRLNLEMAVRSEMFDLAYQIKPDSVCLVPENRQEVTTEGGLAIKGKESEITRHTETCLKLGIAVSLFIEPDLEVIKQAHACGASHIEIHTGRFALIRDQTEQMEEVKRIQKAAELAKSLGLVVNAGHGLHYHNVQVLLKAFAFHELNIGHAIISRAVLVGLDRAVREMLALL
jgi:pyridoxine 5-phosphate synthase